MNTEARLLTLTWAVVLLAIAAIPLHPDIDNEQWLYIALVALAAPGVYLALILLSPFAFFSPPPGLLIVAVFAVAQLAYCTLVGWLHLGVVRARPGCYLWLLFSFFLPLPTFFALGMIIYAV